MQAAKASPDSKGVEEQAPPVDEVWHTHTSKEENDGSYLGVTHYSVSHCSLYFPI